MVKSDEIVVTHEMLRAGAEVLDLEYGEVDDFLTEGKACDVFVAMRRVELAERERKPK